MSPARPGERAAATAGRDLIALVVLFLVALAIRGWAAAQVPFPPNEVSAYYAGVARNLVEGRGLVTDAIWSYATPPLVLPKPAFELWLPMATFLAAIPMAFLGTGYASAQLGSLVVGAAVAPLTYLVAREAASRSGLESRRVSSVALGSGLVAAALGPFLIAAAAPDSTTPFLVLGVAACLLMPRTLDPRATDRRRLAAGLALGVVLGLAYLSRQEAIYLGLAFLFFVAGAVRASASGRRGRTAISALAPTVVGGLAVVVPWLARNAAAFGTLFPGQALENVYLTRNEEIFAYLDRPTLRAFLDQGAATILGNQLQALWHDLGEVLLLQAMPVGIVGIVAFLALRRSPAVRGPTALRALLVSGVITYLVTSLLLPVATRWGTFLHASGPLVVGLTVTALLGLDAAVARLSGVRGWARPNALLAPLAMLAVTVPLGLLQVSLLGGQSRDAEMRVTALRDALGPLPELAAAPRAGDPPSPRAALISDHPIWMAEALRRPVIALPDEPPGSVARLAGDFGTALVLVIDMRGRYPGAFDDPDGARCFTPREARLPDVVRASRLYTVRPECVPS